MSIRPLIPADAGTLIEVWNRAAPFDVVTPALFHEKVFDDPDVQPEFAVVAEQENVPIAFAVGVGRSTLHDGASIKMLCVDPQVSRRGIGSALLKHVEESLAEARFASLRIGESPPNYLSPGVDVRYTLAVNFFEKHGYERFDQTYNMEAPLTDYAKSDAERSVEQSALEFDVQRATPADLTRIVRFVGQHWATWIPEIEIAFRNDPISLHFASKDGDVVGFSAFDCNNLGTGWFGPMGTSEENRESGIGSALLDACLRDIAAQGHRHATIPWVGPVGFYVHSASATISRVFFRYQKYLTNRIYK